MAALANTTSNVDKRLLIRGATIVTINDDFDVLQGDLLIVGDRITEIAPKIKAKRGDRIIRAKGMVAMPGLVQCHVHTCQTLTRSQADDMELLEWLRERIWPLEGAMNPEQMRIAVRLGMVELLKGGTTTVLDMGTVQHGDVLFEQADALGLRYTGGKTMMDQGQGFPAGLRETTDDAIVESIKLCDKWHGYDNGRLRYAFSPRFALSCSEDAMRRSVVEARKRGALLHTHAAENSEEVSLVRQRTGMGNVEYLHHLGFSGSDVLLAHCIWLSPKEHKILRDTKTRVVHCPSANLKLASGIARIAEFLDEDIHVALGADGAGCNNNLDGFMELRLLGLLHKVRSGPTAVPARQAVQIATRAGAQALGLTDAGYLAVGAKADITLLDLNQVHTVPAGGDMHSRIVYSARSSDVHTVIVDGKVRVKAGQVIGVDEKQLMQDASAALKELRKTALLD